MSESTQNNGDLTHSGRSQDEGTRIPTTDTRGESGEIPTPRGEGKNVGFFFAYSLVCTPDAGDPFRSTPWDTMLKSKRKPLLVKSLASVPHPPQGPTVGVKDRDSVDRKPRTP